MSKILGTVLLIAILLTSCNKAQEVLIPKKEEQATNTTIAEVKPNTTTSRYPKTKNALINAAITYLSCYGLTVICSFISQLNGGNAAPPWTIPMSLALFTSVAQSTGFITIVYNLGAAVYYGCTERNKKDE